MGIFTGTAIAGSRIDAYSPAEQELQCEGVDINFYEASMVAVAESEAVYNKAMKEIGIGELRYMEENGKEMIYEAVDIKAVFGKIKMFFKKLMDKVKAIFHAFIAKLSSWNSSDKDFVKKYETEFGKKWNDVKSDFEFKGYNFTLKEPNENGLTNLDKSLDLDLDDEESIDNANAADIKNKIKKMTENREDILDSMRANVVNAFDASFTTKTLDSKEFSEELFKIFRNNESEKQSIEKGNIEIGMICNDLRTSADTKKKADSTIKKVLKSIDAAIKKIDGFEKEAGKSNTDGDDAQKTEKIERKSALMGYYSELSSCMKSHREFVVQAAGAYLEALKDRSRQWKAIMVKVIAHSDSKKMKRESYDYTNESYSGSGSFLDSIVLK